MPERRAADRADRAAAAPAADPSADRAADPAGLPAAEARRSGSPRPAPARTPGRPRPAALVTGASSGIGAAVAARLAPAPHWDLLLTGRDRGRLADVAARTGGRALPADLSGPEGCRTLARRVAETAGPVELLVAGAGVGWAGRFRDMPPEAIERLVSVNLCAPLHLVRLLLPEMARRGRGHVVLVSSVAGAVGVREEAVYSATKAALCAFADSLRYELADRPGLRVTVVLPGAVDTPFFARRGVPYGRRHPRPVPPERVAEAVHRAVRLHRDEVFVPAWLRLPARLHGAAPALFRRLAARFA